MSTSLLQRTLFSPSWWLRDRDGKWVVGQWPNPALLVWLAAISVRALDLYPSRQAALVEVGRGALIVWALDELVRGANPMRRVLGLVVLVFQIVSFVRH